MKYGNNRLEIANIAPDAISTLRGPNTMPSHTDSGPISIWPTVKAVGIQAPSSNPAWIAPRTSARPKVVRRPASVEITAPSKTAMTPISGRGVISPPARTAWSTGVLAASDAMTILSSGLMR